MQFVDKPSSVNDAVGNRLPPSETHTACSTSLCVGHSS
jgi:hypothetical protein